MPSEQLALALRDNFVHPRITGGWQVQWHNDGTIEQARNRQSSGSHLAQGFPATRNLPGVIPLTSHS